MMHRFICIVMIFTSSSIAQNFNAGLIGGATTSQISGDQLQGYNKLGAKIGSYISYPINKLSRFQLELLYIQKGSKNPFSERNTDTYTFELNYIEMPLLYVHQIAKYICLETGLGLAYLFSYKEENQFGKMNSTSPKDITVDGYLGLYYQWKENTKLNLRFSNSISAIRKGFSEEELGFFKGQYSTILSLSLFYQISRL